MFDNTSSFKISGKYKANTAQKKPGCKQEAAQADFQTAITLLSALGGIRVSPYTHRLKYPGFIQLLGTRVRSKY
ncbi:MAG: hypothetical protein VR69_14510 [Peptococcaceae bacterium BRH_c4b]|nr:MAG: hypothetical protein VR69_14510 [Peptococcaceae bacterium BRH_c4b]